MAYSQSYAMSEASKYLASAPRLNAFIDPEKVMAGARRGILEAQAVLHDRRSRGLPHQKAIKAFYGALDAYAAAERWIKL